MSTLPVATDDQLTKTILLVAEVFANTPILAPVGLPWTFGFGGLK